MKILLTALLTALVVATGAGAYVAAVTPGQFAQLKAQVANQSVRLTSLEAAVSTLRSQPSDASTVACLKGEWNQLIYWPQQDFVWNTVYYSGVAPAELNDGILSFRNVTTTMHQC